MCLLRSQKKLTRWVTVLFLSRASLVLSLAEAPYNCRRIEFLVVALSLWGSPYPVDVIAMMILAAEAFVFISVSCLIQLCTLSTLWLTLYNQEYFQKKPPFIISMTSVSEMMHPLKISLFVQFYKTICNWQFIFRA